MASAISKVSFGSIHKKVYNAFVDGQTTEVLRRDGIAPSVIAEAVSDLVREGYLVRTSNGRLASTGKVLPSRSRPWVVIDDFPEMKVAQMRPREQYEIGRRAFAEILRRVRSDG